MTDDPATPGGDTAVIVPPWLTVTELALTDPKKTVGVTLSASPVMVTAVPPEAPPLVGVMLLTTGRYANVYCTAPELPVPPGSCSVIVTVLPGVPAGADGTSMRVDESTVAATCWLPKDTVVSGAKFEPVICTSMPPDAGPAAGDTADGTGGP